MDNFVFSLNVTLPVFVIILLGWILKNRGLFTEEFVTVADKYVFKIALPILCFKDIATADIRSIFDLKFILFCMSATTLMFAGVWCFARIYCKDRSSVGAFAQAAARGSAAILGIAFVENIYGSSGMAPMMIISAVPLYNIYATIMLTLSSPDIDHRNSKSMIYSTCRSVIHNPIIIGVLCGLVFNLIGWHLPAIPYKSISYIANTATPIALLVVGASFEGRKALKEIRPSFMAALIKLIIIPAVFFPFAILFGFRGSELVAILIMLGSPTTVSCYTMAKNLHNNTVLTSSVIVLVTLLSSISLTFWIFMLKTFALI